MFTLNYVAMAAEVIKYYLPKAVERHNYPDANSVAKKMENWRTLSSITYIFFTLILLSPFSLAKVLTKHLGLKLSQDDIQNVATCKNGAIEWILLQIWNHVCNI